MKYANLYQSDHRRFALVRFGGGVSEMRGSIAGNVFSRNRSGAYARNRITPVNPQTNLQTDVRDNLAFLSTYWNTTLTAAQRTAWNDYGAAVPITNKLGETIFLSGQNMFIRTNTLTLQNGLTQVDDGPTTLEQAEGIVGFSCSGSEATGDLSVVFDDTQAWADEDNAGLLVRMSKPHNTGVSFIGGPYRNAPFVAGNATTAPTSPATSAGPYVMTENQSIKVLGRIIRADGRVGPVTAYTFLAGS